MPQARDKVRRNVASLITVPEGRAGRPSKAMTLAQAVQLLATLNSPASFRLSAYVVLSLLTGVRTEEARARLWSEVDLDAGTVAVCRSVRAKGDTKTRRSRRVLKLPGRSSRRCGHTAGGRRRNACGLAMHGRIMGSSSAVRMALPWIAGSAPGAWPDHQGGRAGGAVDSPRAASFVRVDSQRE